MDKLKCKTILIGKEPELGRLLVAIVGGKSAAIGAPKSVPASVSRCLINEGAAHVSLAIDSDGNMILTNLNNKNITYVNGTEIASKRISLDSTIELGKNRYNIPLQEILKVAKNLLVYISGCQDTHSTNAKKKFDISHLKDVWATYEGTLDRIAHQQQENGRKKMLPIMAGSLSGVASPILATLVAVNTLYITVPIAAISFGLYFSNYKKKDTSYEDRKSATEKLTDEYVCPNPDCNKFLGNISYKLLKKQYNMQCPYCKSEFMEK